MRKRPLRPSADRLVPWTALTATTLFVLWQLYPSFLIRNRTPAFNDLPGHFYLAWQVRHRYLAAGEVLGWSNDWFTGYPVLTFYFPFGPVLVALLSWVVPLSVALKLCAAAAPVTLPAAAYAFGRLHGRDRLTAACYAVAVLPLLLEQSLALSGGAISASVGSGEYAYGLSFSLGLLALGVAGAGLRTGRYRLLTACLVAATMLAHAIPTVFVLVGIAVMVLQRRDWAAFKWATPVVAVALALPGAWLVPLIARNGLTAGAAQPEDIALGEWLLPVTMAPVVAVAVAGLLARTLKFMAGLHERDDVWTFMAVMAVVAGIAFVVYPAGRIGVARFIPVWFLWLSLLAGDAVAAFGRAVDDLRKRTSHGRGVVTPALVRLLVPLALFAAVLPVWTSRIGPGVLGASDGAGFDWPKRTFMGYEGSSEPDEYRDLLDTLRRVGREHGCGRTDWEWAEGERNERTTALMFLIPYYTRGCLQVTKGPQTQASATTPFLDVTNQRLSTAAVHLQGGRHDLDVARGVADLRLLGVRYYISSLLETQAVADQSADLRPVGRTKARAGGRWKVYEVVGPTRLVEPLPYLPVVVPGGSSSSAFARHAGAWYERDDRDVFVAAGGPQAWPRRSNAVGTLPRRPARPTRVSDVRVDHQRISFRVAETGRPVLVKVSYFPNWEATGADGPWRVSPNHMVVVPTERAVTLRFGRTSVDHTGRLLSLAGLVGAVALARNGPVEMPERPVEQTPERAGPPRPAVRRAKGAQGRKKARSR